MNGASLSNFPSIYTIYYIYSVIPDNSTGVLFKGLPAELPAIVPFESFSSVLYHK